MTQPDLSVTCAGCGRDIRPGEAIRVELSDPVQRVCLECPGRPAERDRIDRALSVLAKLDRLPDAGTHKPDCWLTENHRDCLVALLEQILRGES